MENSKQIANRLKKLRLSKGWEQTDVAKKMGYKSFTTISKWETGTNLPNGGKLAKLAKLFDTTTDYILFGVEDKKERATLILSIYNDLEVPSQEKVLDYAKVLLEEQNQNKVVSIFDKSSEDKDYQSDYVQGLVAAGNGTFHEDNLYMEVRLRKADIPDKYDTIAKVAGDSMEPLIRDNDLLFIEVKSQLEPNAIGIFLVKGKNFVKKLKRDYDGRWYLQSLNDNYDEITLTEDNDIRTIGEVVSIYR